MMNRKIIILIFLNIFLKILTFVRSILPYGFDFPICYQLYC